MKILTNTLAIGGEIQNIIENSENYLYLISPFNQLERPDLPNFFLPKMYDALDIALQKGVSIKFVARPENDSEKDPKKIFEKFINRGCELYVVPNLHAKIYGNESRVLITSMNMFLHSIINNDEIGVLLTDKEDLEILNNYVNNLTRKNRGLCFRCGSDIKYDQKLVYTLCKNCFFKLKQFGDDIGGYYCHSCGIRHKGIKKIDPICNNCKAE